jgi:OmpA-OmpF porin, OOP family
MQKKQTAIARLALGATLLAGAIGAAQAEGIYVGGGVGVPDYHSSINGVAGGGSGTGVKLYGGYQFNPNFAVELGGYELGHIDNSTGKANVRGAYVDAVGFYPLNDRFSLLGSAGVAQGHWDTTNGDDSSAALKLGAGVQYQLTGSVGVRAQYERYMYTNAFDQKPGVGETTVGLNFKF